MTDPTPAPGVWLADLATGRRRHAGIPPEQREGMARWTGLLGALVTVDGVWRTTGTLLPLRPRDADEVTDLAREMLDAIVAEMSGEQLDPPPRPALPEPHGDLIAETEPSPGEVADLRSEVLGAGMPRPLRLIATNRSVAPQMVDSDGDALTWRGRELDALEREPRWPSGAPACARKGRRSSRQKPARPAAGCPEIHRDHAGLRVDVNSKERLEGFLDVPP